MANRFQDQYRPQHNGDSVFLNKGGYINKAYSPAYKNPHEEDNGYPYKPEGGSSVSRKPKSPTKPSSGGMALPIPQKVK